MWTTIRQKCTTFGVKLIRGIQMCGFDMIAFLLLLTVLGATSFVVIHTLDTLNKIDATLARMPQIVQTEMQKTRTVMVYEAEQDRQFVESQHLLTKDELLARMNEINEERGRVLHRIETLSQQAAIPAPAVKQRHVLGIFPVK